MSRFKNKLHEEIYDEARKIEKITEEVKAKCIEEIKLVQPNDTHTRRITIKAIRGV